MNVQIERISMDAINKIQRNLSIHILFVMVVLVIYLDTINVQAKISNSDDDAPSLIDLKKYAISDELRINETLEINIIIKNNYDKDVRVLLKEKIDFGKPINLENLVLPLQNITIEKNETIIGKVRWFSSNRDCVVGCKDDGICDPDCNCTFSNDPDCFIAILPFYPYYSWSFTIKPGLEKKISYKLKFNSMGVFIIPKTVAETSVGTFYSNTIKVRVKCNPNGECELKNGEYYENCPEDCPSGSIDLYCDEILDGICDRDCNFWDDPDCSNISCNNNSICEEKRGESYENCPYDCKKQIVCGNGICESDEGENFLNCREDCPPESKDKYCNGIADGICDPDCLRNLDEDCFCNHDGICEIKFENFLNCPNDCPSGLKDNYCDRVYDDICDPDCQKKEDIDCKDNLLSMAIIFILFLVIVAIVAVLIYRKFKHS
ncbi:MAG: hypothetical protein QXY62_01735 [Candidatus Altiarchaeota archaeon]